MAATLSSFVAHHGIVAIFILMGLESVCIPIPSEVVMPYAGYMAYMGEISFIAAVVTATLANVVGGLLAYYIGRAGGRPFILRYGKYILLSERHLAKAEKWFAKYGELTVFFGRLLPAIRTFVSLPAGVAKMPIGKFVLYSTLGSIPWNVALVWIGLQLGMHWSTVESHAKPFTYFGALVLIVAVAWFWFGRRNQGGTDRASR